MGYLATEIIVLLAGAAVLGLVIGWAIFGLGKKQAPVAVAASPKLESELKAERDARKKAEARVGELEAKSNTFNDKLQERDTKVAELSHQLDEQSKYRVHTATELEARDKRIAALEGELRQRAAEPQAVQPVQAQPAPVAVPAQPAQPAAAPAGEVTMTGGEGEGRHADRYHMIAKLKTDLEAALAAARPDRERLRELERENAELRETLVATAGASPTTSGEKDAIIARLNEEVTGLRAAYESAEQALEEQDAAIDKLTRDLQATQHKLMQLGGQPQAEVVAVPKHQSGVIPAPPPGGTSAAAKAPAAAPAPAPASAPAPAPAPAPASAPAPKAPAAKATEGEATVAVSLADLVDQIDQKAHAPAPAAPPAAHPPAAHAPAAAPSAGPPPLPPSATAAPAPAAKPAAPPPPAPAPKAAPAASEGESTVAISLDALVSQIDKKSEAKAPPPEVKPPPAPAPAPKPAPPPAPPAAPESESTVALSLDALVAQIDQKPHLPPPSRAPATVEASESTVALSLADLVGEIDGEVKLAVAPAPAGALDDLKEIRGIGPATEKRLNKAGIVTWRQMAGLSEADLAAVAELLKISVDKIKREQWVEQARALGAKS